MFKIQLSSNLIPEKIVIGVVPALAFFSLSLMPIALTVLVVLLMLMLVPYSIYTIYMAHLNIAFDGSFAFITNRKTERIVALKNIASIKPASNFAVLRKRWQINYIENGLEEELFFYPVDDSAIKEFIKAVRAQNPMATADPG